MSNLYIIHAVFEAKPGKESELKSHLTSIIKPALENPGCIKHDLHECLEHPGQFMFYEVWESKKDHDIHVSTPFVKNWRNQLDDLLAKPYEASFWSKVN